jgi:hypothetical protein
VGPAGGYCVRVALEIVRQGIERRRFAKAARERLAKEPVGKPGVPGQQGAVEIGPDGPLQAATFEAVLAVVAEPSNDFAEGPRSILEKRPAGVVLESGQRPRRARFELALE